MKPFPRRSRVLDMLRSGKTVFSFKTNFNCPRSAEIMALTGFDCIWTCMEHVPMGWSELEKIVMAVNGRGADVMVRVPRGSYSDMLKPFELDAGGLLIPHVMSREDAEYIVRTTRFHPVGRRPADGGNADGMYTMLPFKEYIRFMNENRFVFIQIEDVEAVSRLDEICGVAGIDGIFFGPCDYSQSIGIPGETADREVLKIRRLVAETAVKHGKFAATVGNADNWRVLAQEGFRFINLGSDVRSLSVACSGIISAVRAE